MPASSWSSRGGVAGRSFRQATLTRGLRPTAAQVGWLRNAGWARHGSKHRSAGHRPRPRPRSRVLTPASVHAEELRRPAARPGPVRRPVLLGQAPTSSPAILRCAGVGRSALPAAQPSCCQGGRLVDTFDCPSRAGHGLLQPARRLPRAVQRGHSLVDIDPVSLDGGARLHELQQQLAIRRGAAAHLRRPVPSSSGGWTASCAADSAADAT